jgi:hypothetical protein
MKSSFISHALDAGVYGLDAPRTWIVQESEAEATISDTLDQISVNITVFLAETAEANLNARDHLDRYLSSSDYCDVKRLYVNSKRAKASYKDQDGRTWNVMFASSEQRLLLATLNADADIPDHMLEMGMEVLESIRFSG